MVNWGSGVNTEVMRKINPKSFCMKRIISLVLFVYLFVNVLHSYGQVVGDLPILKNKKQFLATINWLQDTVLKPNDSVFLAKAGQLTVYVLNFHANSPMSVKAYGDFIIGNEDYIYYKEIVMLLMFGEIVSEIESKTPDDYMSKSYKGMTIALRYYDNILKNDPTNTNKVLDQWAELDKEGKLIEYIKSKLK